MELIVIHHSSIMRLIFSMVVVALLVLTGLGQNNGDPWLRVLTGEDSIIDVNRLSLVLEPKQVITAQFRTRLLKSEPVPGNSGLKYESRIDFFEFDIKDQLYRISKSDLFDSSGKVVLSNTSSGPDSWKQVRGPTAHRLFTAASQLPPFGMWKVMSYRYASGDPASDDDPPELKNLVGSEVLFKLDRVVAGRQTCEAPVFDPKTITNDDFSHRIGNSLRSLGIGSDKVNAVLLRCENEKTLVPTIMLGQKLTNGISELQRKPNFPSQTLIIRIPGNKALMLWDGVFLDLERTKNIFLP